ncbi:hypothetical protein [Actinoplanes friuliensis]|jgi:hypothetical protein|uniref:hypothetical protein n=1 Tax=Actinoplanes friuliensis TaxID=196914 RepID=UPI000420372F|nr:hypothetical protein [Actinoplanes friuliensis]
MTDDEYRELLRLLTRYAETDLDQFDHWEIESSYGPVYVDFSRSVPDTSWYTKVVPPAS